MPTILVAGLDRVVSAIVNALLDSDNDKTSNLHLRAIISGQWDNDAQELELSKNELVGRGVRVVNTNLRNRQGLLEALHGVDGAFLATHATSVKDIGAQVEDGSSFVQCAAFSGVSHIVYLSKPVAESAHAAAHMHPKLQVEQDIRASAIDWTMLRTGELLDSIPSSGFDRFSELGSMATIPGTRKIPFISLDDVGKAAATALLSPDSHRGKIYNLATTIMRVDELQDMLERVEGRRPSRMWLPKWVLQAILTKVTVAAFEWGPNISERVATAGTFAADTRILLPDALDIETWFRRREIEKRRESTAGRRTIATKEIRTSPGTSSETESSARTSTDSFASWNWVATDHCYSDSD